MEGNRSKVNLCLRTKAEMNAAKRQELMTLSSNGANASISGFMDKIREMMIMWGEKGDRMKISYSKYMEQSSDDGTELQKAILLSLSDDIKVGILGNAIEITVRKFF